MSWAHLLICHPLWLSCRQHEAPFEGKLISQEVMLKRQEEEMMQLQARMALRQSRPNLYPGDAIRSSMLDITRDPLREIALETAMTQRKLRVMPWAQVNSCLHWNRAVSCLKLSLVCGIHKPGPVINSHQQVKHRLCGAGLLSQGKTSEILWH